MPVHSFCIAASRGRRMRRAIPKKEYLELWERCKQNMRYTSPNLDPVLKHMTVAGLSGEGELFSSEYDRLLYKHLNPDPPQFISMYGVDGLEEVYPEEDNE